MRPRSIVTFGAGSALAVLAGVILVTAVGSEESSAEPTPEVVGAAVVSVPPDSNQPPPIVVEQLPPSQPPAPPPMLIDARPEVPAPARTDIRVLPVAVSEQPSATAPQSVLAQGPTGNAMQATGIATASVFSVPSSTGSAPRPGIVVVGSARAADELLGGATPDWVSSTNYAAHAVVMHVAASPSERIGCAVLRMQWSRINDLLSVVPLTACFGGGPGVPGVVPHQDSVGMQVAAFVVPRELVDGVRRTSSP